MRLVKIECGTNFYFFYWYIIARKFFKKILRSLVKFVESKKSGKSILFAGVIFLIMEIRERLIEHRYALETIIGYVYKLTTDNVSEGWADSSSR